MKLRSNNQVRIPSDLWNILRKPQALVFCVEYKTYSKFLCTENVTQFKNFSDSIIETFTIYDGIFTLSQSAQKRLNVKKGDDISFALIPYKNMYKLYIFRTDIGY